MADLPLDTVKGTFPCGCWNLYSTAERRYLKRRRCLKHKLLRWRRPGIKQVTR